MEHRPHVVAVESEFDVRVLEQSHHGGVGDGDTFGSARRPRGVDHVRQIVGSVSARALIGFQTLTGVFVGFDADDHHVRVREGGVRESGIGDDAHRLRILDHVCQTLGGVRTIEWEVSAAGLHYRDSGNDHVHGFRQHDSDQRLGSHAMIDELARQLIRSSIEFAVRHALAARDHGDRFRGRPNAVGKDLGERSDRGNRQNGRHQRLARLRAQ